jgi:hypothetical protein
VETGGKHMQAEDIKLTLKQIVESKEVKDLSEQLFKRLDEAALTPDGKIKTYKIDESVLKINPMGGISLRFIINDDEDIVLGTVLNLFSEEKGLEFGALSRSPEFNKLIG